MEAKYRATAVLRKGEQLQTEGDIRECANWAENVIRENDGDITVHITQTGTDEGR